jgi:hypothetical protein
MIKNIKEAPLFIIWTYWAKILYISKKDLFSEGTEFVKKIIKLFLSMLLFVCLVSVGIVSIDTFLPLASPIFSEIASGAKLLVASFFLSLMFVFVTVPPKLDKEQKEKIKKLSPSNEKIFVENDDCPNELDFMENKSGIVIHNENNVNFENISIELLNTVWKKVDKDGNIYLTENIGVLPNNAYFVIEENFVPRKNKKAIYFHEIQDGIANVLLRKNIPLEYKKHFDTNLSKAFLAEGFIETFFKITGNIENELFEQNYVQLVKYRSTQFIPGQEQLIDVISTLRCLSIFPYDKAI